MTHDTATLRQMAAARPDASTWLGANAGSGKTKVLTDRVARLLLDGVDPQNILCLTYTKAAASEMQNRLFARLGGWAMLGDEKLGSALNDLGMNGPMTDVGLRDARRLFARAIEAPGGLKIQTIHSFCASLLRRFPLEAGVSPQFVEMEDRTATLLRAEIVEEIAAGPDADVFYALARHHSGQALDDLTRELVSKAPLFERPWTEAGLANALGLRPGVTRQSITEEVFIGGETELLGRLVTELSAGGSSDVKAADKLRRISALGYHSLPLLEDAFLTKGGKAPFTVKAHPPTKAVRGALGSTMDLIDAWQHRVQDARPKRIAFEALQVSLALQNFAQVFLPAYAKAKQLRGWLDFDDLILRARALLTRSDVAAWVLFRLDGGIDHILVDEAQDTSPVQWQVIDRLAQEFTSGQGARPNVRRTIFVVGDKKQSIYSFQGADPRAFDRMQQDFAERLKVTQTPLQTQKLEHSFRSSPAVLQVVDATFSGRESSGFAQDQSHISFWPDLPGRVDLWPIAPAPDKIEDSPWHMPVDIKAPSDPAVVLAHNVAREIKRMIEAKQPIPDRDKMRPLRPGDILILVQRRSDLFHEMIRACKAMDLPIAGADRLKVAGELAVRDLAALLSFLATPEDDLSLATALRSPLFGWDEAQLFALAQPRGKAFLWEVLRDRVNEFPDTLHMLNDLLKQADYLRPYDLIERILTRHDGRRKLLGRLGPEAEDGIDALLSQALAYEQRAVDSLTGFLVWLETDDLTIKRQMDNAGDRIRVMTVHGSKGLEAPMVILPDTGQREIKINDQILEVNGLPLWRVRADMLPPPLLATLDDMKAAQEAERDRLLYVAMTRAETWLIVAAAKEPSDTADSWYQKIANGMSIVGARPHRFEIGDGQRVEHGVWAELDSDSTKTAPTPAVQLPAFFSQTAAPSVDTHKAHKPSELGGAKALPSEMGQDEETAKARGTHLHLLLEVLPGVEPAQWPDLSQRILTSGPDAVSTDDVPALLAEAQAVLSDTRLSALFAPGTLAEVPITADLPGLGRMHGVVDRLIITETTVQVVDFKTNVAVPTSAKACPEGLLRQMGAYAAALTQIYPTHQIETAILWTRTATLMVLPADLVGDALSRASIP
ncbi:double-strand break repair helicase AddA [Roseovarius aestuarii]|nr:double-strand break repair helicase AddA [Roseovarius aestuarii]